MAVICRSYRYRSFAILYIGLHGFGTCQTMAADLEIRFPSSPQNQRYGRFMVSSLLSTVRLHGAEGTEGISLRTARFVLCCAPSASADSVRLFGSLDQNYIQW